MNIVIHTDANSKIINREALAQKMLKLKPNHSYTVAIRSVNKTTDLQRGYYFAVVCEMVYEVLYNQLGMEEIDTAYKAHKFLERMFCINTIQNKITGELMEIPGSVMDYEPADFNLYLEKIWQWAAQNLDLVIPEPKKQTKLPL